MEIDIKVYICSEIILKRVLIFIRNFFRVCSELKDKFFMFMVNLKCIRVKICDKINISYI